MTISGVRIEGLSQFRAALRRAEVAGPGKLTAGLKRAGDAPIRRASASAPRRTGALASGYTANVRGTTASITSRVPYAAGAEWGSHRKWTGFNRYGSPPRFVWPAVESEQEEIMRAITAELEEIIEIYGWAR